MNKTITMKPIRFLLASVFAISAFAMQAQAQLKIGYINSMELLSYMPEIKQADTVLKQLADDLQKQYAAYISEYQLKLDDYNKNVSGWTSVKKEATEEDLTNMQKRISDFQQTSQDKVDSKKQELYDPILKKANEAVQTVGKENKLTMVLDSSGGTLVYAGEDMVDIMPMVKKKLNLQ